MGMNDKAERPGFVLRRRIIKSDGAAEG